MHDDLDRYADTVPEALTKLVKLEKLDLSMNHLTGARLEANVQCHLTYPFPFPDSCALALTS